jgi:hypothetical protein
LEELRDFTAALRVASNSPPLFIPSRLAVVVAPMECDWLENQNRVRSDAAPGLDLQTLNKFGVRHFRELPLRYLPHRLLAEPTTSPLPLDLSTLDDDDQACRTSDISFTAASSGTVHAFAFWFLQSLSETTLLDTGPRVGEALWRQAAVALSPPIHLEPGDVVHVKVSVGIGVSGGVDIEVL